MGGTLIVERIVGAAAEPATSGRAKASASRQCRAPLDGRGADSLHRAGRRQADVRSSATDEMEMGVGIHGEPGRRAVSLAGADDIAARVTGAMLKTCRSQRGQEVLALVNGLGGTPLLELY